MPFNIPSVRCAAIMGFTCLAAMFCPVSTHGVSLYYWDTNGSSPGSGAVPNGTWGEETANWSTNAAGVYPTMVWEPGSHAVFSAGTDSAGATYTVNVVGTQRVGDIHFDTGFVTLEGGTLALDEGKRLVSALPGVVGRINSDITTYQVGNEHSLTKYKMGTVILGGNNSYVGDTIIEGGVLKLGASERIPDTSNLILANGGTDGFIDTPATFDTGGFSETLGKLKLTGLSYWIPRTIDFGHGSSALRFANSSDQDWEGLTLTIVNFTPGVDSLRFGTDSTGLNEYQLASIVFQDFGNLPAYIDENGYVEPALPKVLDISEIGTPSTVITWRSVPGHTYRVQYKNSLNDLYWSELYPDVTAWDTTMSITDDTTSGSERYYRVVLMY